MFKTLLIAVIAALATSTNGVSLKKAEAKAYLIGERYHQLDSLALERLRQ